MGLHHSPWGNNSASQKYYEGGRLDNFRKLAFLTGDGRFLTNWRETGGRITGMKRSGSNGHGSNAFCPYTTITP